MAAVGAAVLKACAGFLRRAVRLLGSALSSLALRVVVRFFLRDVAAAHLLAAALPHLKAVQPAAIEKIDVARSARAIGLGRRADLAGAFCVVDGGAHDRACRMIVGELSRPARPGAALRIRPAAAGARAAAADRRHQGYQGY